MTVWSHLTSIFGNRRFLAKTWLVLLSVVIITTLFLVHKASAAPNVDRTINFQGRLLNSSGAVVADGYYNMQFKIYEGGNGTSSGNPGGSLQWTESFVNNSSNAGIQVKKGIFSVELGSKNAFGTSVNWDSDSLWLSMNVAGTHASCAEFGSSSCAADGEMLPMKKINATPYAINSGSVGGKTADELVQLGQGTQTDSSNEASISINKTGTGDLMQLQAGAVDIFAINNAGDMTLGSNSDKNISIAESSNGDGKNLSIAAGDASIGGNGGNLVLQGGDSSTGENGKVIVSSDLQVQNSAGDSILSVSGEGGDTLTVGSAGESGAAGSIGLSAGNGFTGSLNTSNLSSNHTYTLSDESGTICLQGSADCGFIKTDNQAAQEGDLWLTGGGQLGGSLNIQTSTNDANALNIQNATGDSLLNVNTTDNKVTIGTVDQNATLMVLDNKTDAGDPAGTNGAMYYNAQAGKFRCFENGGWKDCITPLPVSKVADTDTVNSTTSPVDVDGLSFDLAANTKYHYKYIIIHEAANATTGVGFGVTTPNAPAASNWCANTTATIASTTPGYWGSYCGVGDAAATTKGDANLGTNYTTTIEGHIQTGAQPGTLNLRMVSESANENKVKSGSFGLLQIVQ